jgi:hypothetical protein
MVITGANEPRNQVRRQARILTTIEERYSTDHYRPRIEEYEGRRHKNGGEKRAKILKYVVTIL